MNLQELINITDKALYSNITYYKVIQSKQKELLTIIPANTNITKIDYKLINKYIEHLKNKNNNPTTINTKTAYLSTILNYAYKNNLIQNKPYIPYRKQTQTKDRYLTQDELVKMLLWCRANKQQELLKVILIGYYTGLRINNTLTINKTNYKDEMLSVYDKKTNSYFVIPLSNKIKYIVTNLDKINLSYQQCYYLFNLMKKDLNLDKQITIHTLRHTFCSKLYNKGCPIELIQKLANHKKLTTTQRYTHINKDKLINAISML